MESLLDIPFEFDVAALMAGARIVPESDDARELGEMLDLARAVGRPKAAYRECFVEARVDDTATIGDQTFTSPTLRKNFDGVERVFPFVCTCGQEVVHAAASAAGDFVKGFWWDSIQAQMLRAAIGHFQEHITRRFALGKTAQMNPGSGDAEIWPVAQQRELFALLGDVRGAIGVELTDSGMMLPIKTVSGIRFPTEVDLRSCQICHRANCPNRTAEFSLEVWDSIEHNQ